MLAIRRDSSDQLLDGDEADIAAIVLGDFNDSIDAATTQLLLWNLAPLIPTERRHSRIYRGRRELIDHLLVSRALLENIVSVDSLVSPSGESQLESITDNPNARRNATASDHAPIVVHLDLR